MKKRIISTVLIVCVMLFAYGCSGNDGAATDNSSTVALTESTLSQTESTVTSSEAVSNDHQSSEVSNVMSSEIVSSDTAPEPEYKEPEWKSHPEDYKLIALTFDDAPAFKNTESNATVSIINTLNGYEGEGTLFVVGNTLNSNGADLLKFAVNRGFELGNHTYSHRSVSTDAVGKQWSAEENKEDFQKCNDLVKRLTGITMTAFRPSGAHTNEALYQATAELGMPPIVGNRNVAVSDWNDATTTEQITERIIANSYDGAIILLHSTNQKTAEAVEAAAKVLYEDGYRFCTIEDLFKFKGKSLADTPDNTTIYGIDPDTNEIQTTKNY